MRKLVICAMILLLSSCGSDQKPSQDKNPAIPVTAASPEIKDVTVYLEAIGTLHSSVLMEIRPRTNGVLNKVLVAEGQWVQEGDSLFVVDQAPYEIKVRESKALLAIDLAGLQGVKKKLNRYRELAQRDLVAQTEWDDLEAQVEQLLAKVDLDEARLKASELDLEYCNVKSPVAGRIGKLDAHPGYLVASGQTSPLATVSKMNPLIVEFMVTEKEFSKISEQVLKIEMRTLCSKEAYKDGKITFLDNHFDPKTGLLLVRGNVVNSDHALRPGQSVTVRIPISVVPSVKVIPQKAIRYNAEGPYLYIVQPDMTVAIRQLVLGAEQEDDQIVLAGVDPTDIFIIDGHLRLSPGLKVEINP